ncbi:MAG: hypothetical protein AAF639_00635 [Chloroflexota bacterium]
MFNPLASDLFLQGVTTYHDHYRNDSLTRVVLEVYIADSSEELSVIVDTGAPWCIINPLEIKEIASQVTRLYRPAPLSIRGMIYPGWLYRVPIMIPAMEGEPLIVDATVFVPDLRLDEIWPHPNFIGLEGFLNRIYFAIDPTQNLFYFGAT